MVLMKRGPKPIPLDPRLIARYVRGELTSAEAVAAEAGMSATTVYKKLHEAGVVRPRGAISAERARERGQQTRRQNRRRDAKIHKLRAAGWKLKDIAAEVGLTHQRVQQVLKGVSTDYRPRRK